MNTIPRPFRVYETRRVRSSADSLERSTGGNTDEAVVIFSRGSASVANVAETNLKAVDKMVGLDALISPLQDLIYLPMSLVKKLKLYAKEAVHSRPPSCRDDQNMTSGRTTISTTWKVLAYRHKTTYFMCTDIFDIGLAELWSSSQVTHTSIKNTPLVTCLNRSAPPIRVLLYWKQYPQISQEVTRRSFVLPPAMRVFAELTVFGETADPPSSAFYPTTANSAFVVQRSDSAQPDDSHWHTIGEAAEVAARRYLLPRRSSITPARLHFLHFCLFPWYLRSNERNLTIIPRNA
jgi:hypothetical protein